MESVAMSSLHSSFLRESQARGFIFQSSSLEALDTHLKDGPRVAYIGFDATATSLHVGNLVMIMWLRLLQRCGHKPIVLMGDGTTRVGDPSGKDTQRQLLDEDQIEANIQGIQRIFSQYLTFGDGPTDAVFLRNGAWLSDLNYLDFLRSHGRYFSINRMLSFESVKSRLEREQPLSFLEFNYMILQAYDFWHLSRHEQCFIQMGGSDQWGNIVNGLELIRRIEKKEAHALTAPLITTSDGKKMGKTAQGALWLNADMLSTYEYWQFWRNVDDGDVGRFLRLYTDLSLEEIADLESRQGAALNDVKMILADHATRLCHGQEAVDQAHGASASLYAGGSQDLEHLQKTLPWVTYAKKDVMAGLSLLQVLMDVGLRSSKGEGRRLIREGGCRINDKAVHDEAAQLSLEDFQGQEWLKISAGKKHHGLVILG